MASEITEVRDEEASWFIDTQAKRDRIRRIIEHQRSLYLSSSSSSSFSSAVASCSSFSSSRKSSSLLDLMKEGSTSLRRLIEMEHTSLANHLTDYSGSPVIKPILLWGSDTDDGIRDDPWMSVKSVKQIRQVDIDSGSDHRGGLASEDSFMGGESVYRNTKASTSKRKLTRTKSFRKLPRFRIWKSRSLGFFRIRLRLRRLRIMICGRKF